MYSYNDLERDAIGFILEDESWPVFLAWMRQNVNSEAAAEWIKAADIGAVRTAWMMRSRDPIIRAKGMERYAQMLQE